MTRDRIQQDEVFEAANSIAALGEKPTTLKVHKKLGRGSYSTITKHLKSWEQSDTAQEIKAEQLPAEAPVPEELQEEAQAYIKRAWFAAKNLADAQLDIERTALDAAKSEYQTELEQAINLADDAAEKLEITESENEQLSKNLADADHNISEQKNVIAKLTDELSSVSADLNISVAENKNLEKSNIELNADIKNAQSNLIVSQKNETELKAKIEQLNTDNLKQQNSNVQLSSDVKNLQSQLAKSEQDSTEQKAKIAVLENANLELQTELRTAVEFKAKSNLLQDQMAQMQKQLEELRAENAELKASIKKPEKSKKA